MKRLRRAHDTHHDDAEKFLRIALVNGCVEKEHLIDLARANGIDSATLCDAARRMQIVRERRVVWSLSDDE